MINLYKICAPILIFLVGFWCGKNEDKAIEIKNNFVEYVTEWRQKCPADTICLTKDQVKEAGIQQSR